MSPTMDTVIVEVTKDGDQEFYNVNCKDPNQVSQTRTSFDTNFLPAEDRPAAPTAGTYIITVQAAKKLNDGTYVTRKTLTKVVTVSPP
jgi:hypothetical protein